MIKRVKTPDFRYAYTSCPHCKTSYDMVIERSTVAIRCPVCWQNNTTFISERFPDGLCSCGEPIDSHDGPCKKGNRK